MSAPYLLLNEASSLVEPEGIPGGRVVAFSAKSPTLARENEDCALAFPTKDGVVLAVADGVGGAADGHRASRLAIEALSEALAKGLADGHDVARTAILDAFETANRRIQELGTGAATTLSVVEISGRELRPYHVGDSSVLVCGGRGKVKLFTIAHSPVGYGVEAGLIEPTEALHHADLNIVSNIVGTTDMRIELGAQLALTARDTVVVGTDGLFDNFHVREVVEMARKGPMSTAAKRMAATASERMASPGGEAPSKPDDLTFVVYRPSF